MYSFSNFEPVHCSMSGSNCCFLTCIQVSREVGKVGLIFPSLEEFSSLLWSTVKGFGIVNKAAVFLELSCFFYDPRMLGSWSLVPLPSLNPAWTSGSSWFMYCWSLAWRILSIILLACEMSAIVRQFEHSLSLPLLGTGMKTDLTTYRFSITCTKRTSFAVSKKKKVSF